MSDIRFNNWKHQSGTGGVTQNSGGNVGIGSTLPSSKLDVGGDGKFTGVVTATSFSGSGANLTGIDASAIKFGGAVKAQANNSGVVITGVATATSFVGDGSGLTGITQTTINSNADNRIITGSGTANTLNGEVDLVWDGSRMGVLNQAPQNQYFNTLVVGNNSAGDKGITIRTNNTSKGVLAFSDTDSADANRYDGYIAYEHNNQAMVFYTAGANERLRIDSAGQVLPAADDAQNLGSSTKRWANIYAADMHYSNEGGENSVDGTWGSYTIQEGESDLYLLNNRNGKKYKFVLQEVS